MFHPDCRKRFSTRESENARVDSGFLTKSRRGPAPRANVFVPFPRFRVPLETPLPEPRGEALASRTSLGRIDPFSRRRVFYEFSRYFDFLPNYHAI
jgi:hypothetical protein